MNIVDASQGRWKDILSRLGVDPSFLSGDHGPCPVCNAGKDRFRFDDKDGNGTWICSHCGAGNGFELLKQIHRWEYEEAREAVGSVLGGCKKSEIVSRKIDYDAIHETIRMRLQPLNGEGLRYLRARGLSCGAKGLFSHPGMLYYEDGKCVGKYAAIVAPISSEDGHFLTYHCTYLHNGKKAPVKAPRKIMPSKDGIAGGAVRLLEHKGVIGIAEGIETALAAAALFCVPTWAVLNTSLMESFVPPEGITHVNIFADNDAHFAGQKAAYVAANRLSIKYKVRVEVIVPEKSGEDWLDVNNRNG